MGETLRSVLREAPKALVFVAILVVGWLVAKAVRALAGKVLARVGFDRLAERGGIAAMLEKSRYDASDIVARLAYAAVLLIAAQAAFGIWGPNPVAELITAVVAWLPRAFVAIVIVVVAAAVARAVKDVIGSVFDGLSYGRLLANCVSVLIIGFGVIAALDQVGVAAGVTGPVLIAILATVGGVIVVGVGGGLVRPMQDRWEDWLSRAEDAAPAVVEQARAYEQGRRDAAAVEYAAAEFAAAEHAAAEFAAADLVAAERAMAERAMAGQAVGAADIEATMVISAEATQRLPDIPNR